MVNGPLAPPFGSDSEFAVVSADRFPTLLDDFRTNAVGWLQDRADAFDPFDWRTLEERQARRTAFAEAATCQYVLYRTAFAQPIDELDELLFDRVNDPRYYQLLQKNPREILRYAAPVSYASLREELEPEVRMVVRAILKGEPGWATERLPYEHLQLWHLCNIIGVEYPHSIAEVDELSAMANPPNVVIGDLNDAYALTHDVLYRYDFGVDDMTVSEPTTPCDLEASLMGLVLRFLREGNYDIVLELAAAGAIDGRLNDKVLRYIFSWIDVKAEEHGGVPTYDKASSFGQSQFTYRFGIKVESLQEEHRDWAADYHANLVATIASTIAQRERDKSVSTATPQSNDDVSGLSRLSEILYFLSKYELEEGAIRICSLVESKSGTVRDYSDVFEQIACYLSSQRTSDGTFGVWPVETELRAMLSAEKELPTDRRRSTTTEACRAALAALDSTSEPSRRS